MIVFKSAAKSPDFGAIAHCNHNNLEFFNRSCFRSSGRGILGYAYWLYSAHCGAIEISVEADDSQPIPFRNGVLISIVEIEPEARSRLDDLFHLRRRKPKLNDSSIRDQVREKLTETCGFR